MERIIEETCQNCENWDTSLESIVPSYNDRGSLSFVKLSPCKVNAVFADTTGQSVTLLGATGSCDGEYFQASQDAINVAALVQSENNIDVKTVFSSLSKRVFPNTIYG